VSDSSAEPEERAGRIDDGPETPTRVCPHCSTIAQTAGDYCPHCGQSYVKKARLSRRSRIALVVGVIVVLLVGAGIAVAVKNHQDKETSRKHALALVAARAKKERAEQAQRESEDEKTEKRESEERERKSVEKQLEKAVESDAKKLVAEETLIEPILGASCSPTSGGSSVELSSQTGTYDCIAITKREAGGEVSGYRFSGTIDFADGSFTYHLGSS
jgi:hypothetical protein